MQHSHLLGNVQPEDNLKGHVNLNPVTREELAAPQVQPSTGELEFMDEHLARLKVVDRSTLSVGHSLVKT